MLLKKLTIFFCLISALALLTPPVRAYASARVLTDPELDMVYAGGMPYLKDMPGLIGDVISLLLDGSSQTSGAIINNVNAVGSNVTVQTNIIFSVNTTGDINLSNTAIITDSE